MHKLPQSTYYPTDHNRWLTFVKFQAENHCLPDQSYILKTTLEGDSVRVEYLLMGCTTPKGAAHTWR